MVDYNNAHLYINPDAENVQKLLDEAIFSDGVPASASEIVTKVHEFMIEKTSYVADEGEDDWAEVNDVAASLSGDCEDLVNLEYSLILAAANKAGIDIAEINPTANAAWVTHPDTEDRVGHVFLTVDINGESVVLDRSLEVSWDTPTIDEYSKKYDVDDVFKYTDKITDVIQKDVIDTAIGVFLRGY